MAKKNDADKLAALLSRMSKPEPTQWVRTGVHALDLMMGGGIPRGRIIEIFGNEFAGKSLFGWMIVKAFQQAGGVPIVFDVESATSTEMTAKLGVNFDHMVYERPKRVEELRDTLVKRVNELREVTKAPILVLWDSVAGTSADGEWEKKKDEDLGVFMPKDNEMATRASAISDFFKQWTVWLSEKDVTLVCINQIRDKIGVLYGKKTDSPGGHALKHFSSIRVEMTKGKKLPPDAPTAVECHVQIIKNRCAPPFRKATLRINIGQGFDAYSGLEDILFASGRISYKKAGTMAYKDEEFQSDGLPTIVDKYGELLEPWL